LVRGRNLNFFAAEAAGRMGDCFIRWLRPTGISLKPKYCSWLQPTESRIKILFLALATFSNLMGLKPMAMRLVKAGLVQKK
jgi:hypothetical protein